MLDTGPKFDKTRDNTIYDCYQIWKTKVELIFSSVLSQTSPEEKTSYLRYWMGDEGIPLVKKWTVLGKLDFSKEEDEGKGPSNEYKLKTYWELPDAELKPKGNKILSIIELWTQSKQESRTLNE